MLRLELVVERLRIVVVHHQEGAARLERVERVEYQRVALAGNDGPDIDGAGRVGGHGGEPPVKMYRRYILNLPPAAPIINMSNTSLAIPMRLTTFSDYALRV